MNAPRPTRQTLYLYALVSLGLGVLLLGAFAIVSPFLARSHDDWLYLYFSRRIVDHAAFNYEITGRQYHVLGTSLARFFFPDRFQGLFYIHLVTLFAHSLCVFHSLRRLFPRYVWFAFLYASLLLVYMPFNRQYVMSWLSTYAWAMLLVSLALVLWIEALHWQQRTAWLLVLLSACLGYMSIRGYESLIPVLCWLPLTVLLVKTRLDRREVGMLLVWWLFWLVGTLRFAIPFWQGAEEATYQTHQQQAGFSPADLVEGWLNFHRIAFDPSQFWERHYHYTLPGLLLALVFGLVLLLLARRYPPHLPPARWLGLALVLGFCLSSAASLAFIYIDGETFYRAQMFAAWGQVLMVLSALMLVSQGVGRWLRLPPQGILLVAMLLLIFQAGQWFYDAQVRGQGEGAPIEAEYPFDLKAQFWGQVLAFLPQVQDQTLLLVMPSCTDSPYRPFHYATLMRTGNVAHFLGAGSYLYEDQRRNSKVQTTTFAHQIFQPDGVFYNSYYEGGGSTQVFYRYNQMVLLTCEGSRVELLERFPVGYAPPNALTDLYNPYARIRAEFIPEYRWRVVAP